MADHGSIGTHRRAGHSLPLNVPFANSGFTPISIYRSLVGNGKGLAIWAFDHRTLSEIPSNGTMSGTVKENGVAVPFAMVALYYRKNSQLIARTKASATGTFSFQYLEPGVNEYYAVATHNPFNALIFDRVEAI